MKDERKTKKQLIGELARLRHRVDELEARGLGDAVRQQMEELLRVSVEHWYVIFNTMDNAICLLDSQGRIQRCNRAMVELVDKPLGEILGHHGWEVVLGTSEPIDGCPLVRMWESLSRESLVMPLGDRWFNVSVDPLLDDDGQSIGGVYVMTDITEQRKAEEGLQKSEQRFRILFEEAPIAYQSLDKDGRLIEVNNAWLALFGYAKEQVIGKSFGEFLAPGLADRFVERFRRFKAEEETHDVEWEVVRKDGTHLIISLDETTGFDSQGNFQTHCVMRDVTELARAEKERTQAEAYLQAVLNNAPITIFAIDRQGLFTLSEGKGLDRAGFKPGENVGVSALDLYAALPFTEYNGRVTTGGDIIRRVFAGETVHAIDELHGVYFDNHIGPMRDTEGKVIEIVGVAVDITELKQAGEALQESERRYQLLIENTNTIAWITDQDGKTTFISPNVEQVYGYTPGEIVEAGEALWFGRIYPEDRDRVKDGFESLFSKREQFDLEYRIQRKDGTWMWVHDRAGIVEERNGNPYAYGVFSDITERKQAEEALRKSEAKIRSVIEQSLDGIVLTDEQGVVIEWNRGEEEVTGIERKDALGKPVWDLQGRSIPGERGAVPSTREGLRSQTIEFLRTGEAPWANRLLENELQRPDGTCRVVQSVTFPIKTSQGFMAGTISRDITEQKQAERALRQSKDELTRAQQIAHMGNWNWDVQNNTLTWSEEVYRIFGVDRDFELTYEDIETMVHPDDREMNQEKVDELLSGTDSVEYEFRITRPDGTVRYIYQNAQISHDDAGGASRIFGIIHDITERKQAEQALAHQAEQLRLLSTRLSEAQEAERRRIAHELHDQVGQNLTVLGINLNTLRPHLAQAPEEVRACLNDSLGLVKQTTGRIRDVMADLRPPELDDYGLLSALRWYVDQIRLRTGLAVAVEGDSLHPRLSSQQETALFRIAQEALTNVVKHAQATQATVTLEASERQLRMIITDDGVGLDPASLAITNETPHWGVLTMKERAQAIGACWRVESNLGGGTRVVVEMARRLMAHPKGDQQ